MTADGLDPRVDAAKAKLKDTLAAIDHAHPELRESIRQEAADMAAASLDRLEATVLDMANGSDDPNAFPVDQASLDLLEACIINVGGVRSDLFGGLEFLSGVYEPHQHNDRCVALGEDVWDCTEGAPREFTPQDVILALIAEIRRLREVPGA